MAASGAFFREWAEEKIQQGVYEDDTDACDAWYALMEDEDKESFKQQVFPGLKVPAEFAAPPAPPTVSLHGRTVQVCNASKNPKQFEQENMLLLLMRLYLFRKHFVLI